MVEKAKQDKRKLSSLPVCLFRVLDKLIMQIQRDQRTLRIGNNRRAYLLNIEKAKMTKEL